MNGKIETHGRIETTRGVKRRTMESAALGPLSRTRMFVDSRRCVGKISCGGTTERIIITHQQQQLSLASSRRSQNASLLLPLLPPRLLLLPPRPRPPPGPAVRRAAAGGGRGGLNRESRRTSRNLPAVPSRGTPLALVTRRQRGE